MTGYVYAFNCGHRIKIGYSAKPIARLHQIKTNSGAPVTLVGCVPATREQETELHKLLAPERVAGREWYSRGKLVSHFLEIIPKAKPPSAKKKRAYNALDAYLSESGVTNQDFASWFGVTGATISRIRRGKAYPSIALALSIERFTAGIVAPSSFAPPSLSQGDAA